MHLSFFMQPHPPAVQIAPKYRHEKFNSTACNSRLKLKFSKSRTKALCRKIILAHCSVQIMSETMEKSSQHQSWNEVRDSDSFRIQVLREGKGLMWSEVERRENSMSKNIWIQDMVVKINSIKRSKRHDQEESLKSEVRDADEFVRFWEGVVLFVREPPKI
jgi:hypothetical protein